MRPDNPFAAQLGRGGTLSEGEIDAVCGLMATPREAQVEQFIVHEGDRPTALHVLLSGWAARVKMLPDGRRLLPTLIVAGDVCDIDGVHVRSYDFGVVSLAPCWVSTIDLAALVALCDQNCRIARTFAWLAAVNSGITLEAATSLGRRSARERLAHLLCELRQRLHPAGQADAGTFPMPLSQERMADVLGLTAVHVNRTLQAMRSEGLVDVADKLCSSRSWSALEREAGFSPNYLRLDRMRGALAA